MKTLFVALLMASAASSAFAADLPTRKGYPVAPQPMYTQPAFTWGGLYVGINGGYAFGNVRDSNFAKPEGGMVGGTLGYNWQMGQIVFGAEGDFDYAFSKKDNGFGYRARANGPLVAATNSYQINWITTERLRLGYAFDRAMVYVTGGYAGMSTRASVSDGFGNFSQNEWRSGAAVGGGVEYAFTNNISAKAEYLWLPMEDKNYWNGKAYAETNKLDVSLFRVGLNYKF